jgi:hypothetical protein
MGRKIILALLVAAAWPAVVRAQARPAPLLSSAMGDSIVVPELEAKIIPIVAARSFERSAVPPDAPVAQGDKRLWLLQHVALGALAGFVAGSAFNVMSGSEYYVGFAGMTAVLGALGGVVIWNIRVMP